MTIVADAIDAAIDAARGPRQKPRGKSKQDYGTPWEFIRAVESRFGPIECDLAAHAGNKKCERYYDKACNSLMQEWAINDPVGTLWLNPEYGNIEPWAAKCARESRGRLGFILMLTPAAIGTEWFENHVRPNAFVLGLRPRIPFDGMPVNAKGKVDGYPKDLMLSVFGYGLHGFDTWRWK